MSRKLGYSLLLFTVAASAYLAGSWRAPSETASAATKAEAARTPLYYQCPMHPDIRSDDKNAPCGLCGMSLEPVYAGGAAPAAASPGDVAVGHAQQQLIGVKTGTVEEASGTSMVRVFGRVTPEEPRVYRLSAGLDAYVSDVSTATTGSIVRKGQWLASFSTPDARLPIGAFISASNVLDREEKQTNPDPTGLVGARTSVMLARERLLTMGMSTDQIEEIRRTRIGGSTVKIAAPADGFVLTREVSVGQRLSSGDELFRIADLRRVWILADVPAGEGDRIRPGADVQVTLRGRPMGVRARISTDVPPQFDAETQTFRLRLEADNPGYVLRPDMFVDVDLQISYPPALLVPADAVVVTGRHNHVFVEKGEGVFEPREVELGLRRGDRLEIVKGLSAGERIATSGVFLLDSESRMKGSHGRPTE